jgi:aminoglycoside phosphotransferase family enzyme
MEKKIHENFDTLAKLKTVDPKFENTLILFVKKNKKLFYQRIREDKIRDIHGDLYLKNIFILENNKFYLYDRLEFNDDLRYADIAEDMAHLSMDLDYHKRSDLRKHLISQYIEKSSDTNLENLVYFLMCYKACIRSMVSLFHAKNETIAKKRIAHIRESKDLLKLAASYLESF